MPRTKQPTDVDFVLEYNNAGGKAIDHAYLIDSWGIDVTSIETVRVNKDYCKTLLTTTEPWLVSSLKRKFDTVQYMRDNDVYIGSVVTITPKSSPAYAAKANNIKRILNSPGDGEAIAAVWDAFGTHDVDFVHEPTQKKQRAAERGAKALLQMSRSAVA